MVADGYPKCCAKGKHFALPMGAATMIRLSPALPFQFDRPSRAAGADAAIQPVAATPPAHAADPALDDWHDLFCAVTDRLRQAAAAVEVQECVAALDQMSSTLKAEIGRSQQQRFEAQAALAQALDQLSGGGKQPYAHHLALQGSITALPEQRIFRERLDQALRAGGSHPNGLAVLYIGLEGLRAASDGDGQALAEALLWTVGARLSRALRAEDLVSHFGGDEFACLVFDMPGREPLRQLACKLIDALAAPFCIGARTIGLRPSIGIATGEGGNTPAATWLGHADASMAQARQLGLGHAFHGDAAEPTAPDPAPQ